MGNTCRVNEYDLSRALAGVAGSLPPKAAAAATARLIDHYRGETPTEAPVLRGRADVVAYAAYRMPATHAAASAALRALAARAPGWAPRTHLDIGGGTGAAAWAAAATWEGVASTVVDWAEPALALGRELAEAGGLSVRWTRGSLREGGAALPRLPDADLVTVSYVLGELTERDRRAAVATAARAARGAVVLVEPGTPDGYLRIREARDALVAAGLRVRAPCPHSGTCPIAVGEDWCHFAARVSRSSLHRRVKGGELAYEDEKFSYVAAVREEAAAGEPAPARVVRRPRTRKGQVLLELCGAPERGLGRETVTKRHGAAYRAARKAEWGDAWEAGGGGAPG
ncbi:small ribosomal subunit Rsm22 family protein [Streptomyces boncukensis]|uniref:Methyltransferase domain-containing protein n=1 Tax=Streptomyces boncukensis TaxID=2711219 RepID=A0A6G4X638_9ACTN|nr:methyltransferase domain-containing protein [Streptomyces boncukensis]